MGVGGGLGGWSSLWGRNGRHGCHDTNGCAYLMAAAAAAAAAFSAVFPSPAPAASTAAATAAAARTVHEPTAPPGLVLPVKAASQTC